MPIRANASANEGDGHSAREGPSVGVQRASQGPGTERTANLYKSHCPGCTAQGEANSPERRIYAYCMSTRSSCPTGLLVQQGPTGVSGAI